jgi:hypothetical protein
MPFFANDGAAWYLEAWYSVLGAWYSEAWYLEAWYPCSVRRAHKRDTSTAQPLMHKALPSQYHSHIVTQSHSNIVTQSHSHTVT